MTTDDIRVDFDRLAAFQGEGWSHNSHYHPDLLRHVPPGCESALDLGCGAGAFTRLLAGRAERVLGLDLSPEMIRVARSRATAYPNIAFEVADARTREFPAEGFDCIATIATLHHMPLEPMLVKLRDALRPGGVLLVLDLFRAEGLADLLVGAVAFPADVVLRLRHRGGLRESPEARAAWAAHGRHDRYLTLSEIRRVAGLTLPGAVVCRRLLWRYTLTWRKTGPSR